jgi:hypothetical protein
MNIVDGNDFLIKYLGLIFVLAGIIRYFLYDDRKKELNSMNLPNGFDYIIIIFELIIGFTLFFNITDRLTTLLIFLIFLSIGTILILVNNFNNIISEINTVFTFQPTAMCFVFHFTYIIMIIGICLNLSNTSKNKISIN